MKTTFSHWFKIKKQQKNIIYESFKVILQIPCSIFHSTRVFFSLIYHCAFSWEIRYVMFYRLLAAFARTSKWPTDFVTKLLYKFDQAHFSRTHCGFHHPFPPYYYLVIDASYRLPISNCAFIKICPNHTSVAALQRKTWRWLCILFVQHVH